MRSTRSISISETGITIEYSDFVNVNLTVKTTFVLDPEYYAVIQFGYNGLNGEEEVELTGESKMIPDN
jgi:hypothetical protein